jgi:hypothetical protein
MMYSDGLSALALIFQSLGPVLKILVSLQNSCGSPVALGPGAGGSGAGALGLWGLPDGRAGRGR